jgi:ketosteroid isomerase-like protein
VTDGEVEAMLELLDAEVNLEFPSAMRQEMVTLHGTDEARGYLERTAEDYVELRIDPREFRPLDAGRFLVLGRWTGRASGGATPFGTPLAMIIVVREGKVAQIRAVMDEQQALEAAAAG